MNIGTLTSHMCFGIPLAIRTRVLGEKGADKLLIPGDPLTTRMHQMRPVSLHYVLTAFLNSH